MSLKEWKDNELNTLLMKKWGLLKEGAKPDFLDVDKDGDKKEPMKSAAEEAGAGEESEEVEEGYYRGDSAGMGVGHHGQSCKEAHPEETAEMGGDHTEGHGLWLKNGGPERWRKQQYGEENPRSHEPTPGIDAPGGWFGEAEGHGHPPARREEEEESDPEVARAYGVGPKAGTKPEPGRDRMEIPAWKDKDVPPPGANVAGTKWQKAKTHKKLRPASARETKETLTLDDARDVARRIFEKINKGKK